MKHSSSAIQLKNLFEEKLLSWSQPGVLRWIVARSSQRELLLPPEVAVWPRAMHSRAVSHRAPRQYRNASLVAKRWPDDHLSALKIPKLLCVTAGHAVIELGEYELDLPTGTFLFIPPGIPQPDGSLSHMREQADTSQTDICWISPHGDQLHFWQCRSVGHEHFILPWSNVFFPVRKLTQYFDLLRDEAARLEKESPLIPHLLTLLLMEMQREIETEKFLRLSNRENTVPQSAPSHDPIATAVQYLNTNFEDHITLESLARQVGMSRSQLARRFHEDTGQTVMEYLTQKRLEQACKLLRETEYTITHIVGFVGFRSAAHFHTLFRNRIGSSPTVFRRQYLSNKDDRE